MAYLESLHQSIYAQIARRVFISDSNLEDLLNSTASVGDGLTYLNSL